MLSTILAVYCALAVLSAGGLWALQAHFAEWFQIEPRLAGVAGWVLWIVGLRSVVLALPLSVFRGALFGSERILAVNLIQVLAVALYAVGVWAALGAGFGILGLAVTNLLTMVLEHGAYVVVAYRTIPGLRLSPGLVRAEHLREVGSFSLYSTIGLVAGMVMLRADPVLVSVFLPLAGVAVYGVALKVAEYGLVLTKQFVHVLTPYFARLGAQGVTPEIRSSFERSCRLALLPPAVAWVSVAFLGGDALRLWAGPDFGGGGTVLTILSLATLISAPQLVASSLLSMTGQHRFTALAAGVSIPINVGASLLLVGPLGLTGVALGTLTSTLLIDVFVVVPRALSYLGIPRLSYARGMVRAVALPMALQAIVLLGIRHWSPPSTIPSILATACAGGAAFAAVAWRSALTPGERSHVSSAMSRLMPRIPLPRFRRAES